MDLDFHAMVARIRLTALVLTCACHFYACEGPMGPRGRTGQAGAAGPAGTRDGGAVLDAGKSDAATVDAGAAFDGVFGLVRDRAGMPVVGGRVFLVPAQRVAELATMPIDLTVSAELSSRASHDEPLEDILDLEADMLPSALSDPQGNYRLAPIPEGAFFVVYKPALEDGAHLPGGDAGRTPRAAETLRGARLDLVVSSVPSAEARYVGSSPCVTCHARHSSFASAHALTLRVPGQSSPMQDTAPAPRIDEALHAFERGTILYFYDCAANRAPLPACRVRSTAPADLSSVRMRARLLRDRTLAEGTLGAFYVELETPDASTVARYPVVLTLGGALSYQQYVTRVALPAGGFTYLILPFSYQLAGDDTLPSYRDFRWVAYRAEDWVSLAQGSLSQPAFTQAFDRQCAGCHVTGLSLRGDAAEGFRASAVAERDGVFDLDGDGRKELLAVGCESCHGPGSEHIERSPRGQHIVSPQLLTPERQTMLCGNCHGRHLGIGGALTPLDQHMHMPRAGLRRSEFLAGHVSAIESGNDVFFGSGDSRLGRQQYTDFLQSTKYRNGNLLATCSDCHAPHRERDLPFDLRYASSDSNGCVGCHAAAKDLHAHALAKVGYDHVRGVDQTQLTCARCHMVKTGAAGAHTRGLLDQAVPGQSAAYFMGDRTSHRFRFVSRAKQAEQPTAATDGCAYCHSAISNKP